MRPTKLFPRMSFIEFCPDELCGIMQKSGQMVRSFLRRESIIYAWQPVLLAGDGGVTEVDLNVVDFVDVQHGEAAGVLTRTVPAE